MANTSGHAYALTLLCPIRGGVPAEPEEGMAGQTHAACLRNQLQAVGVRDDSPMALVPNTYLSRFYVLNDVPYQGKPAVLEHLQSAYLVFSVNFHGELDAYLAGMWTAIEPAIRSILKHCYGFDTVHDRASFVAYVRKCQVTTTFFFNGSTDEPLDVQLKSLYLKQEFSRFAFEHQGLAPRELQAAFEEFVRRTQPGNLDGPTWRAGSYDLETVVDHRGAKGVDPR